MCIPYISSLTCVSNLPFPWTYIYLKFKVRTNRVEIAPKLQRNYFLLGFVSWHIHLRQKIVVCVWLKWKNICTLHNIYSLKNHKFDFTLKKLYTFWKWYLISLFGIHWFYRKIHSSFTFLGAGKPDHFLSWNRPYLKFDFK